MFNIIKKFQFLDKILFLIVLSFLFSKISYAAGFASDSHSASALGTSYAGSVSGANDISDSFFNPETLSKTKKNEALLSIIYINFKVDDNANYNL
jgi:long-subunit fatty acid transport protein